jgi:hypothetical protein
MVTEERMDRYERMRSGDWSRPETAPNFSRMARRPKPTQNQLDWLADGMRVALALSVLALLAAFIR